MFAAWTWEGQVRDIAKQWRRWCADEISDTEMLDWLDSKMRMLERRSRSR